MILQNLLYCDCQPPLESRLGPVQAVPGEPGVGNLDGWASNDELKK